jgi:hypothetical protein
LCARCLSRTTLDWEERGEQSLPRAFLRTVIECASRPSQVGARLSGPGHVLAAQAFAATAFLLGLLPGAIVLDVLLFTFYSDVAVGFPQMSVLSLGVSLFTFTIVAATLMPPLFTLWAGLVVGFARAFGVRLLLDAVVRCACYGPSLCSIPWLGPVLLPLGLVQQALLTSAHVARHGELTRGWALSLCVAAWLALLAVGETMLVLLR